MINTLKLRIAQEAFGKQKSVTHWDLPVQAISLPVLVALAPWTSSSALLFCPFFPSLQKAAEFILILLSGTAVALNVLNLAQGRLGSR